MAKISTEGEAILQLRDEADPIRDRMREAIESGDSTQLSRAVSDWLQGVCSDEDLAASIERETT